MQFIVNSLAGVFLGATTIQYWVGSITPGSYPLFLLCQVEVSRTEQA